MNLKILNQNELDQRIKSLAQKERDLLHEVLLTIQEIDTRRTFLELGFGSLFEYLVQGVGYSEGSAQRRIDSARMIREIPAVAEKIQSGELKLNQISLIQKASREVFKSQGVKVTALQKQEILECLVSKNHAQSQQQVAAFFDLPVENGARQTVQADESVHFEFTLSKEEFAEVKQAQELLSHSIATRDVGQFLVYLARKVIKQKTATNLKGKSQTHSKVKTETEAKITAIEQTHARKNISATVAAKESRPSMKDIRLIRAQQGCCQYTNPKTGKKCQSSWKLEIDHKQSRWAGGTHGLENLQQLCGPHNKMKYQKEVGIRYR